MTPRQYRFISNRQGAPAAGAVADFIMGSMPQGYNATGLMSGPSSVRPQPTDPDFAGRGQNLQAGIHYLDTTLGYVVVSDGLGNWVNPSSGATV